MNNKYKKSKETRKNIIRRYRSKMFGEESLKRIDKKDFNNLMNISKRSVLGRMTAINSAFYLGYNAGQDDLKKRIVNHFEKGGGRS